MSAQIDLNLKMSKQSNAYSLQLFLPFANDVILEFFSHEKT